MNTDRLNIFSVSPGSSVVYRSASNLGNRHGFLPKDRRFGRVLLAPGDNIAVACAGLPAGTQREIGGIPVVLKSDVDVGHKFAVRTIKAGERMVKYGAPIGRATRDIEPGDYVHLIT